MRSIEDQIFRFAMENILQAYRASNGSMGSWNVAVTDHLWRMWRIRDRMKELGTEEAEEAISSLDKAIEKVGGLKVS